MFNVNHLYLLDTQNGEDILSEKRVAEAEAEEKDNQSISVAQGYNSQSIAVAYPGVDDYDGQAKVEIDVAGEPSRDYVPPTNDYLPPAVFNQVSNQDTTSLNKAEEVVDQVTADEVGDNVVPVAIVESKITEDSIVDDEPAAILESEKEVKIVEEPVPEGEVKVVYGAPPVVETRKPKTIDEEVTTPEVKIVEDEVVFEDTSEELPADDAKTVLVVEEPTPVIQDIPEPIHIVPAAPVPPAKTTRVFSARRPSYVPQRRKVYVPLEQEEYVPVYNRQVVKPKKEIEEEEEKPFPFGASLFPIKFGDTSGAAIAIANSFTTSKGGSSKSQAVAYGSGSEAFKARQAGKSQQADGNC